MSFIIPSWRDVLEDPTGVFPQAEIDPVDIDALLLGIGGDGVLNGCTVTPASPTGMLVDVASGQVAIGGTVVDVSAQPDVSVASADLSQPRHDLVVVDSAGIVGIETGDPFDQSPPFPAIPGDAVPLATLYIPASLSAVLTEHIIPKDVPVPVPRINLPGWEVLRATGDVDLLNDNTLNNDSELKFSMAANTRYNVRAFIMFEVLNTSTSGQSPNARFGFNGPASPTRIMLRVQKAASTVANATQTQSLFLTDYHAYETTGIASYNTASTPPTSPQRVWFDIQGMVQNGATEGDFVITWAQQAVSTVINTTRLRGSWLEFQEV